MPAHRGSRWRSLSYISACPPIGGWCAIRGALPDRSSAGWVFPSERIVTALLPDNVIRRCIRPRLEPLKLGWITFAVLRRSHSTLHKEKGTDPKVIADQQGHGLGVHVSDYVESSLALKREAVSALWADFKAVRSEAAIPI